MSKLTDEEGGKCQRCRRDVRCEMAVLVRSVWMCSRLIDALGLICLRLVCEMLSILHAKRSGLVADRVSMVY